MERFFSSLLFILLLFGNIDTAVAVNNTDDLPECVVVTHCVLESFEVGNVEEAFKKSSEIIANTPRTKIVEATALYLHAEARTKWRRYTDDFLVKAFPGKGIIQVRSESRVGIGDNGVNKKRVDDFAYRLMTNQF